LAPLSILSDASGELLFQVLRKPDKSFPQRRPDGHGGWHWNTKGVRKVLYRLPEVIEAIANGQRVVIVEGEKDRDRMWSIGIPATCNPGGASKTGQKTKWRAEYTETLRGADIVVIGDHDAAGAAHAHSIAQASVGIAKRVRVLHLVEHWPQCPRGGDVSDYLDAGHTREEQAERVVADLEAKCARLITAEISALGEHVAAAHCA